MLETIFLAAGHTAAHRARRVRSSSDQGNSGSLAASLTGPLTWDRADHGDGLDDLLSSRPQLRVLVGVQVRGKLILRKII